MTQPRPCGWILTAAWTRPTSSRAGLFTAAACAAALLRVPADALTWPVRAAVAGAAILVAGFAVFLVGLTQAGRDVRGGILEGAMRNGVGGR